MEVSFSQLKEKEIINLFDGKKLGRVIDVVFESSNGVVKGIVVPGERKIFRKNEDVFISLEKIRKIGDDVILVSLRMDSRNDYGYSVPQVANVTYDWGRQKSQKSVTNNRVENPIKSFVRYKRIDNKKYK